MVEVLDVASGKVASLAKVPSYTTSPAWASDSKLLVIDKNATSSRDRVIELLLDQAGAVQVRREVYAAGQFELINQIDVTQAGAFIQIEESVRGAYRLRLDAEPAELEPLRLPGDARAIAGWNRRGELVLGLNLVGTNDVVAVPESGPLRPLLEGPLDDVPIAVVGDHVWIQRRSGQRCTTHRLAPDRSVSAPVLSTGCSGEFVACAGDRAPPCLVAEQVDKERRFRWWDGETGERGQEVLVEPWPRTGLTDEALSTDGTVLAMARFDSGVDLINLRTGVRRTITTGGFIQFVTWAPGGDLYATDVGEPQRLIRIRPDGSFRVLFEASGRWFGSPRVSADGGALFLLVNDRRATFFMEPQYKLER